MIKTIKRLFAILLLLTSGAVSADSDWDIGAGLGFMGTNQYASGTFLDGGSTHYFEHDEEDGGVIAEFYFINRNLNNWSFVVGVIDVTEGVNGTQMSEHQFMSYIMMEAGFVYNLLHFESGWFLDAGWRAGFALDDTDQRVDYGTYLSGSYEFASGYVKGYNKIDIGMGKAFENFVVRLGLVRTAGVDGPTIYVAGTDQNVTVASESEDTSKFQLTVTYWW